MINRLLPMLALAAMAACGTPPKDYFYTLGADATSAGATSAGATSAGATSAGAKSAAAYSVAVGPISVPDMVDRPQLVLRAAANQVTLAEHSRWAEPLRNAIPRVVAGNLAQELLDARLSVYPQPGSDSADLRVLIDIHRFDSTLGEGVLVEALWTVRGKYATQSGRSLVREAAPGKDHEALVAAHSAVLRRISSDIANTIRQIPRTAP
jgi:uncharacterized protein